MTAWQRRTLAPVADPPDPDEQPVVDSTLVAEQAHVGALVLVAPAVRDRLLVLVRDADLADPQCRWVSGLVRAMVADGQPVDAVTVVGWARRHASVGMAQADRIASWLSEATAAVPVALSAEFYAAMLVEAAVRREVAAAGGRLMAAADRASLDELAEVVRAAAESTAASVARALAATT